MYVNEGSTLNTILRKSITATVIFVSILTACSRSPSEFISPTQAIFPTAFPTSTLTATPAPILLGNYELLSPEDMRHDLDELFFQIEKVHPDPYTKRSKSDIDRERQRIYDELGKPMTMIDFYRMVDPLISSLGDYHTLTGLPGEVWETFTKNELILQLDVQFDGQKA